MPHRAHARETCVQFGSVQDPERTHRALTHVASRTGIHDGITRLPDKRDKRHDHDSIGDQTRSRHCAHYTVHFRLCGGRAAHFCILSTFRGQGSCHQCSSMQQTLCFVSSTLYECRPLRSWKVPSSVSDCADGGLGISLPRSARVVAVTRPAPLLPKHPHRT